MLVPAIAPDLGIDASWCAVLDWAHQQGLQFGKDIVFTYGPLGYLVAPYCLEPPGTARILFNAALCFHIALGLSLLAWKLAPLWRYALLGFFVAETANAEIRADLLLNTGLFCWGLLCTFDSGDRRWIVIGNFVLLAAFSALTKVNFLFVAGFSACALTGFSLLTNERKAAWAILPAFAGGVLLLWLACGQALSHFAGFLWYGLILSREYDQAAGLGGLPILRTLGVLIGLSGLVAATLRVLSASKSPRRMDGSRQAVLVVWIAGQLFTVGKHSLVRMDRLHFFDLAVFAPVVALALEALPASPSRSRSMARGLSLACCALSLYTIDSAFLPGVVPALKQVFAQAAYHWHWLFSASYCRGAMAPDLDLRRNEAQLPAVRRIVSHATIDVFGFHQAHALLNQLQYHPRPVFQSYVAYNGQLARLNEKFYLSAQAPDYVLFELTGLEHRFPALDDSLALRAILANYRFVTNADGFLLLKHASSNPPALRLLKSGDFPLGQRLDISRNSAQNLWVELEIDPTWLGRLYKFVYHAPTVRLSVWANSNVARKAIIRRQAAPSLLETGFIGSPFLVNTAAVQDFYAGREVFRPGGFSIEATGPGTLWQKSIHFQVSKIETPPGQADQREQQ
ncbi:MAG TPA: hypothetical protein VFE51_06500 [Verrucomicrobiae bacterium]|nr:hypothetical protein [Verrucomicrobiae bacterium]